MTSRKAWATSGAMSGGVQTAALMVERTRAGTVLAGRKGLTTDPPR